MSKSSKKSVKKSAKKGPKIAPRMSSAQVLADTVMAVIDKRHRPKLQDGYQLSVGIAGNTFKRVIASRSRIKRSVSTILARHPSAKVTVTSRNIYISL